MNGWPMMAVLVVALVIMGAVNKTVSVSIFVPVPPALVAERVTVFVLAAVGVPEITPFAVSTLRPTGKPVAP